MTIRAATAADVPAIVAIWNPVIRDSIATFNAEEKSPAMVADMLSQKAAAGHAFLVALHHGQIAGFAHYGQFRGGIGYRHTAEHTIVLGENVRGQGIGRSLLAALEDHARTAGFHSLWAGVSGENVAGVAFHARAGFARVAVLPQVGRKFDRWFDLVLMQKRL
jgi:phosphinothricin acetyltransferase